MSKKKLLAPKHMLRSKLRNTLAGNSFDQEISAVLRSRLLLLFSLWVFASLFINVTSFSALQPGAALAHTGFAQYYYLSLFYGTAFSLVGLLLVFFLGKSKQSLYWIAFLVTSIGMSLAMVKHSIFMPGVSKSFAFAVVLLTVAAFVPWTAACQLALGSCLLAAFVLINYAVSAFIPDIALFWQQNGGHQAFVDHVESGAVDLCILTAIGYFMTRNLHHLQKSVHKFKQLGNYSLKYKLGAGGMGEVHAAQHNLLCRPTAIKVLNAECAGNEAALLRFEREVRLCAALSHPNTVTIFDYGRTAENTFYYAMEFLEGYDLQNLVEKFGPIPAERVVYILKQACGSLFEAHNRGIIHRDIKPANIFLTVRGEIYDFVKVLDFGLARSKRKEGDVELTQKDEYIGTPRYISPESVYGSRDVDHRSDLYNLGAVAYFLLTGQPIFAGSSSTELIVDHVKTVPPNPALLAELPIPQALDAIVMRCLEKEPKGRFDSAQALRDALDEVPLDSRWSQEKAKDWWELHFDSSDHFHICPQEGIIKAPQGYSSTLEKPEVQGLAV